ncbi:MAG: rRNA maturation RNase YbeY [Lewinellaceae bacterium]|nr:rRNA maturation RNase YbeY [Lewinella sp.]MCB9277728.1 rRNA maturation RNase YbeY [Lewinellaceae bacterium]
MTPAGPDFFPNPDAAGQEEPITFFSEDIDFELSNAPAISNWISSVISAENSELDFLNFIFCSDNHLHQINVTYLDHDDLTDVITFPYAAPPRIQGDIFISIDRVRENAGLFNAAFEQELRRVMIHGVLHLCGYKDKTPEESTLMRQKEEESLNRLTSFILT